MNLAPPPRPRLPPLVASLVLALGAGSCSSTDTASGPGSGAGGAVPPGAGGSMQAATGGGSGMAGGAGGQGGAALFAGGSAALGTGGSGSPGAGGSAAAGGTAAGGTAAGGTAAGGTAAAACPGTALAPGETRETVDVGGTSRTYVLHVPSSYDGSHAVPLVVDWHFIFGTGAAERLGSGYAELSEKEGFVVAFPDGIDAAWNIGPCCTTSRTVDDLGFARALVAQLESRACIDPKRVYAVGFSMGGGMSYYLACNAADLFAAVAPAAFDLLADGEEPCHPSRPISVIAFRGTADPIVPYAGGASNPPNGLPVTIHFQGAQATFAKWAALDHCAGAPASAADGCATYSSCDAGTEVTLCTKTGGGHETGDAAYAWKALERHPMP